MIITKALGVAADKCCAKDDFFRVLSLLNLLNTVILDKCWKHELTYGFIKGGASRLFEQWIANPIEGVTAYYNSQEGAVFFKIDVGGVQFPLDRALGVYQNLYTSAANRPIEWAGGSTPEKSCRTIRTYANIIGI